MLVRKKMPNRLTRLQVQNFRSLQDVNIELGAVNVLFGPNGAGKSSLLDTIWFVRDCVVRGVDEASSFRNHGYAALWDGADEGAHISIKVESKSLEYEISFAFSSGRIDPLVGEALSLKTNGNQLIDRKISSDTFKFHEPNNGKSQSIRLRESARLALTTYQVLDLSPEAAQLENLLRVIHFYGKADLSKLKTLGSQSSHQTLLEHRGRNLWAVLRNLHDRRDFDERYNIIMKFMKKSFPRFEGLFIEQTGPQSVYGHAFQKALRQPIPAFGMSDGQLQMLIHLTALFSQGRHHQSLLLFDEPETSLHPYALVVFAEAVELATTEWNKQVLIASHSPVLISQFELENVFALELGAAGQTIITRVSEMTDIQDLLEEYATGSLYMAEMIAPQSKPLLMEAAA